ncbi:MAG: hypothetical protein PHS41_10165 [Victivallaceae bacterium]|nr:hypothetical protein [Victivallaceae bacterium]
MKSTKVRMLLVVAGLMLFGCGCGDGNTSSESQAKENAGTTIGSLPRRQKEKIQAISAEQQKKLNDALQQ